MYKIINSHSHIPLPNAIFNCNMFGECDSALLNSDNLCSIGVHPWDAEKISVEKIKPLFEQFKSACNVVAVGECGLDRVRKVDLKKQREVFLAQLELASENSLPVVIHCVRAWSDLFPIMQMFTTLTYILHDFRANVFQTTKLLEYDTYFSFGKSILKPSEKIKEVLGIIPKERILIETDEENIDIESILESICLALQTDKELFRDQLIENTNKAFNL